MIALICIFFLCASNFLMDFGSTLLNGKQVDWADPKDVKYVVSLRNYADMSQHLCGGSIYLRGQWILTARSCLLHPKTKKEHSVVAVPLVHSTALHDLRYAKYYSSKKTFCHPFGENGSDIQTDIGLVKLRRPIPVVLERMKETDLETLDLLREDFNFTGYYDRTNVYISGWGKREVGGNLAEKLRRAFFKITKIDRCQVYNRMNFKHPNHICIRYFDILVKPCHGDERSPAVFTDYPYWNLLGIIPTLHSMCKGHPFVMNVSHFREFIDDVLRHEPAKYECRNVVRKN